jgi:hypothetical protein
VRHDIESQLRRYAPAVVASVTLRETADAGIAVRPRPRVGRSALKAGVLGVGAAVTLAAVLLAHPGAGGGGTRLTAQVVPLLTGGPSSEYMGSSVDVSAWGTPLSAVEGGRYIWVLFGHNVQSDSAVFAGGVVRVDEGNLKAVPFAQVASPSAVAAANGDLWVTSFTRNVLVRLDQQTGAELATVALSLPASQTRFRDGQFLPNGIAASGTAVWVITDRGYAEEIDPATDTVSGIVPLGFDSPQAIAVDGSTAWVADGALGVARIDSPSGAPVISRIIVDSHIGYAAAIALGEGRVWVAGNLTDNSNGVLSTDGKSGFVAAVDPRSGVVLSSIRVPFAVDALTVTKSGVWAAHFSGGVQKVSDGNGGTASNGEALDLGTSITGATSAAGDVWAIEDQRRALARIIESG